MASTHLGAQIRCHIDDTDIGNVGFNIVISMSTNWPITINRMSNKKQNFNTNSHKLLKFMARILYFTKNYYLSIGKFYLNCHNNQNTCILTIGLSN